MNEVERLLLRFAEVWLIENDESGTMTESKSILREDISKALKPKGADEDCCDMGEDASRGLEE